jgi:hypothetical protein
MPTPRLSLCGVEGARPGTARPVRYPPREPGPGRWSSALRSRSEGAVDEEDETGLRSLLDERALRGIAFQPRHFQSGEHRPSIVDAPERWSRMSTAAAFCRCSTTWSTTRFGTRPRVVTLRSKSRLTSRCLLSKCETMGRASRLLTASACSIASCGCRDPWSKVPGSGWRSSSGLSTRSRQPCTSSMGCADGGVGFQVRLPPRPHADRGHRLAQRRTRGFDAG